MTAATQDRERTDRDLFVDLVCADEDLVRAEFDAIVEAFWPGDELGLGPVEPQGGEGDCHEQPEAADRPVICVPTDDRGGRSSGREPPARERAPPGGGRRAGPATSAQRLCIVGGEVMSSPAE